MKIQRLKLEDILEMTIFTKHKDETLNIKEGASLEFFYNFYTLKLLEVQFWPI